jgi:hypothetical protein
VNIQAVALIDVVDGFVETDVKLDPDDDYQDVLIRIVLILTDFDNYWMNYFNIIVERDKLCVSNMPQLFLFPYLMIPLIVIFMNLIMIHSQGVTFKDITQLN